MRHEHEGEASRACYLSCNKPEGTVRLLLHGITLNIICNTYTIIIYSTVPSCNITIYNRSMHFQSLVLFKVSLVQFSL